MTPADLAAILCGGLVGLVLALVGGGGSILATPLLIYVVGVSSPHVAIGTSAMAVAVNAFANLIAHARAGNVKWPCAATFGGSGVLGALIGAAIGKQMHPAILLPLFALLMISIALTMLHPNAKEGDPDAHLTPKMAPRLIGAGLAVGFMSGFFGIGGGFLIVPGLMLSSGMAMLNAVASSLFSVGAFGAATAVSYALDGMVDWRVAALFITGGIIGGLIGAPLSKKLATQRGLLRRSFAILVLLVAIYILYRSWAG
ncbi:MAG: sulfite exporter TauE/SafE family protein [Caulobacterales bacterium]